MNKLFAAGSPKFAGARSIRTFALLFAVFAAACVSVATAHAQTATRTWVSGTGTNNSNCSRTEPCALFSQALAVTSSYGEIDCLDPGGFGTLTINIPVTINCEGISAAGVQVTVQSADGITITATGPVTLIGLDINGTKEGLYGVLITGAGQVTIRNCKIYGWQSSGIEFDPGSSGATLIVDNVSITDTYYGVDGDGASVISNMTVRNSSISNNAVGIRVVSNAHAGATIEQTTLAFNNGSGLLVENSGAVAIIGGSTVVNNGTGVSAGGGASLYSAKNNQIYGNGSDGTPITAYPGYSGGGA